MGFVRCVVYCEASAMRPSGAKAQFICELYGTTKVVPLQTQIHEAGFSLCQRAHSYARGYRGRANGLKLSLNGARLFPAPRKEVPLF